jgi:hypothetical protein
MNGPTCDVRSAANNARPVPATSLLGMPIDYPQDASKEAFAPVSPSF